MKINKGVVTTPSFNYLENFSQIYLNKIFTSYPMEVNSTKCQPKIFFKFMEANCRRRLVFEKLANFDLQVFQEFFFHHLHCFCFIIINNLLFTRFALHDESFYYFMQIPHEQPNSKSMYEKII